MWKQHLKDRAQMLIIFFSAFVTDFEAAAADDRLPPGSCSNRCQKEDSVTGSPDFLFQCSCSPSCAIYGDCCYDSLWRSKGNLSRRPDTVCLPLSRRGRFEAFAECPASWNGTSEFCIESVGHLPPVTSLDTGATYANVHCALCHEDAERLRAWEVELKCCPEHESHDSNAIYTFSKKHMWSVLDSTYCLCRYVAKPDAKPLANELELRRCDDKTEISTCSPWWTDKEVERSCKSYVDNVYLRNKVYRNSHCARCNFENLTESRCRPKIVDDIFLAGAKYQEARQFCEDFGLRACVHFLGKGRGRMFAFSHMFSTREMQCVPPKGKRCCKGEKYDLRHKACRKVKTSKSKRTAETHSQKLKGL